MPPPSGEQIELARGPFTAVVTEVGATLRSLRREGSAILWEFGEEELSSGGRGQVLAPWPNRLEDGEYAFEGREGRAALDEPARRNAIHGLVRWLPWRIEPTARDRVALHCRLHPQPGYPFDLDLELDYRLTDGGLEVECRASTPGDVAVPFGIGFHPYLDCGPEGIDEAEIDLAAAEHVVCSDRGLPTRSERAAEAGMDLRSRALRGLVLDDCFGGLAPDGDGRWWASVRRGGASVAIWADAAFAYAMCYTGDTLPEDGDRRRAIAIEPMTCPPNALRTGVGLVALAPGERFTARWGIAAPSARGS